MSRTDTCRYVVGILGIVLGASAMAFSQSRANGFTRRDHAITDPRDRAVRQARRIEPLPPTSSVWFLLLISVSPETPHAEDTAFLMRDACLEEVGRLRSTGTTSACVEGVVGP